MSTKRLPHGTRAPVSGIYEQIGPRVDELARRRTLRALSRSHLPSGAVTLGH